MKSDNWLTPEAVDLLAESLDLCDERFLLRVAAPDDLEELFLVSIEALTSLGTLVLEAFTKPSETLVELLLGVDALEGCGLLDLQRGWLVGDEWRRAPLDPP